MHLIENREKIDLNVQLLYKKCFKIGKFFQCFYE